MSLLDALRKGFGFYTSFGVSARQRKQSQPDAHPQTGPSNKSSSSANCESKISCNPRAYRSSNK